MTDIEVLLREVAGDTGPPPLDAIRHRATTRARRAAVVRVGVVAALLVATVAAFGATRLGGSPESRLDVVGTPEGPVQIDPAKLEGAVEGVGIRAAGLVDGEEIYGWLSPGMPHAPLPDSPDDLWPVVGDDGEVVGWMAACILMISPQELATVDFAALLSEKRTCVDEDQSAPGG